MRSIRTTNNNRRRMARNVADRVRREQEHEAIVLALLDDEADGDAADEECGQCEGTGTIQGGLSGDQDDEECPVCDGTGTLSGVTNGCW